MACQMLSCMAVKDLELEVVMITQCCVCRKIRKGTQWDASKPEELLGHDISHGYCPVCALNALAEIYATAPTKLPSQAETARASVA